MKTILEEFDPTGLIPTKACEVLVRPDKFDRIVKVAELIFDSKMQKNLLIHIPRALAMAGDVDGAITIVRKNVGLDLAAELFQEISEQLAAVGKFDGAFKVARKIVKAMVRFKVFKELSSQVELDHLFDQKLTLIETIPHNGDKWWAYASILQDLIACSKLDKADTVIEKMYALIKMLLEEDDLTSRIFRACEILVKVDKIDQAIAFVRIIDHPVDRGSILLEICKILAEANLVPQALNMLREFGNDQAGRSNALDSIIEILLARGQIDEIIEIAKILSNADLSKQKFGGAPVQGVVRIVRLLTQAGYFEKAREVIQGIPNEAEKSDVSLGLAEALVKAHRSDEALEIIEMVFEGKGKSRVCRLISEEFARAHRFDEALKVADMISDEGEKSRALCVISEEFAEAGLIDKAFELIKIVPKIPQDKSFIVYTLLEASQTADHMDLVASYTRTWLPAKDQKILFMALFERFAAMGHIDKALEISRDISDPHSLSEISKMLKALGKVNEAKEVDQRISALKAKT